MTKFSLGIPLVMGLCFWTTAASADDWIAQKLRGEVSVLVHGSWVHLKRGDVISNTAPVRTMKDGQVEFVRDHETITLSPNTQIQIFDRTGQRYTTVKEAFGTVRIEANVENVQHFVVQTPFVAATVKGTIFTVASGPRAAKVRVKRGKVGVTDLRRGLHVDVVAGQSAAAGRDKALTITGAGPLGIVVNTAGQPVTDRKGSNKASDNSATDNASNPATTIAINTVPVTSAITDVEATTKAVTTTIVATPTTTPTPIASNTATTTSAKTDADTKKK